MQAEEELWRQHSWAIWMHNDDQNTKYFHQFATYRRNCKHVWEITDDIGQVHSGQIELKVEATKYLKSFFAAQDQSSVNEQVITAGLFSRMVNQEEVKFMESPCTLDELKEVLKLFKKDKSPGPDGWTIEFFIYFFDLVGGDLLEMVEEFRIRGEVVAGLNLTFLALIPKVIKPTSFEDYRPISLCNLCYKLISKIIANMIKPFLARSFV